MGRIADDFWASVKVGSPEECWPWLRARNPKSGYGVFKRDGEVIYVHRHAYELVKGTIADGLYVCHTCDNRRCVNPAHLWLGVHEDNMRDMVEKNRGRKKSTRPRDHGLKLSHGQVRAIRLLIDQGRSQRSVAVSFGISQSAVWRIAHRQAWDLLTD